MYLCKEIIKRGEIFLERGVYIVIYSNFYFRDLKDIICEVFALISKIKQFIQLLSNNNQMFCTLIYLTKEIYFQNKKDESNYWVNDLTEDKSQTKIFGVWGY